MMIIARPAEVSVAFKILFMKEMYLEYKVVDRLALRMCSC